MSVLRSGNLPVFRLCALSALAAVGGCASSQAPGYVAANAVPPPRAMAQAAVVEDDGLPVQAPPPAYIRRLPDDPSEPFSPNYGGSNPAALGAVRPASPPGKAPTPKVPEDLPAGFRHKLVTALNQDE